MANWTIEQVSDWLRANGFKKQVKMFKDKTIDGNALMKLTDYDISELLLQINTDGSIQESTIGIKSRFRTILKEWKIENQQKKKKNRNKATNNTQPVLPNTVIDSTNSNKGEHKENKDSDNDKCKVSYVINDEIQVNFFKNSKFQSYVINLIKQNVCPVDIKIKQANQKNNESCINYTIKVTGTKQENHIVGRFIKYFDELIKLNTYKQHIIEKWLLNCKSDDIIKNILNKESHVFTVCEMTGIYNQILKVYYFVDEKMDVVQISTEIDDIIQNKILQENILFLSNDNKHTNKFIDMNTNKMILEYRICPTEQYEKELDAIINECKQNNLLISLTWKRYHIDRSKKENMIEIFGYGKLVNEVSQKFKDLFIKHQLRKFKFNEMSSAEFDGLANLCYRKLKNIEREFRHYYGVQFFIEQNYFYASQCLKDEIESRVIKLLSNLKTYTFKSVELYYDIADRLYSNLKTLAKKNHCYCYLKTKTKLKFYPIPRAHENTLNTSQSIIEQSDLFCSLPSVFCRTKLANGSIEVLIGDIAVQKVDIIIIPSTSFGLKESLIERAGEINQLQNQENSTIPFITETTSGRLNCKKILFVNWSVPTWGIDNDYLSESITTFISKTIQYVIANRKQTDSDVYSIAFAVPDMCEQEQVLAEEMIEETMNQIKSIKSFSLNVSFILLPDQKTLHKQFLNILQEVHKGEDNFGMFSCPTSIITITLISLDDDYFTKCEQKINNYLNRCVFNMKLDGFTHWNQHMINAFYKYANDRYVLPKLDNEQQIVLYSHINNVYEVSQKYHLTNRFIQEKTNLMPQLSMETSSACYNIMLSCSSKDLIVSKRLANRLVDEGFSVWMNSKETTTFDQICKKINKSDCIIFCISKHYFEDQLCKKITKYADKIGKHIIFVKIQNYEPIEWLKKLTQKDSCFQLFGSDNNFNLECDKLLLKILQYTKPSYILPLEKPVNRSDVLTQHHTVNSPQTGMMLYFLLTPEQKRSQYEKNIKKLMKLKKEKIMEDENDKENHVNKIQQIIFEKENQCKEYIEHNLRYYPNTDDSEHQIRREEFAYRIKLDSGIFSYKQWLEQNGNLKIILNVAPFTLTGNINDAVFPMLHEALQNSYLLQTLREHHIMPPTPESPSEESNTPITSPLKVPRRIRIPPKKRQSTSDNSVNDESNTSITSPPKTPERIRTPPEKRQSTSNNSVDDEIKPKKISRRVKRLDTSHTSDVNSNDSKKKKEPGESTLKQLSRKRSFSNSEKLEFQMKFVEQMKKNEYELQKLCEDVEYASSKSRTKICYGYPTALFGLCPFPRIKIKPSTTLPTHNTIAIPLKFPWNSGYVTEIRTMSWTNPSTFFFFEASQAEKH
ncbi:unnamed protein product [Adineta steineri]|uniref:SAM domain-containing protein n=1 Tax=Adineta steineri TaxID=433720 RepID=A0A814IYT7_9BILA|nr:unnamed protein product [Adineta steineri]CAF1100956.1 unnamed protein product [Adineta steineri]